MIGGIFVGSVTSVSVTAILLEAIELPLPLLKLNGFTVVGLGPGAGVATRLRGTAALQVNNDYQSFDRDLESLVRNFTAAFLPEVFPWQFFHFVTKYK